MRIKVKNLLLIASSTRAHEFLAALPSNKLASYNFLGWINLETDEEATEKRKDSEADKKKILSLPLTEVDKNPDFQGMESFFKIRGNLADLDSVLGKHPVEEILVLPDEDNFSSLPQIIELAEREGIPLRLEWTSPRGVIKKIKATEKGKGHFSLYFPMSREKRGALWLKRIMDLTIALILLSLLWPLFLIIALLIKLTSPGPVFYEWRVVGQHKKPFRSWKFRTMIPEADNLKPLLHEKNIMKGPVFKAIDDPRVTKVGRFLRKYSLDELPQLWTVIKGEMSLVGPRPAGPHELIHYEPWQRRRLSVKPGITGLWQVSGRNAISDFNEWVKLDLYYIDNWSLWLDLKILWKTIGAVLKGTGI